MSRLDAATVRARMTAPLVIGETVDLRGCHIEQALNLSGAVIGNVDLTGATFSAPVTCAGTTFAGLAWFKGCTFEADADFSNSLFENDARFDDAQLSGNITFASAELRGVGAFDAARFKAKASFDEVQAIGNLSFAATVFDELLRMRRAVCCGGLWLNDTVFKRGADLTNTEIHGRMWHHGTPLTSLPVTYGYTYRA